MLRTDVKVELEMELSNIHSKKDYQLKNSIHTQGLKENAQHRKGLFYLTLLLFNPLVVII